MFFCRPDTLDPALLRPGRIDRKIEFALPDTEGRANILRIHARSMSVERNIRYELIGRLCPNATGAELRSVCTEAGMYAIRQRRKVASEKDFLDAVDKVIKRGSKFSSTGLYSQYNVCSSFICRTRCPRFADMHYSGSEVVAFRHCNADRYAVPSNSNFPFCSNMLLHPIESRLCRSEKMSRTYDPRSLV